VSAFKHVSEPLFEGIYTFPPATAGEPYEYAPMSVIQRVWFVPGAGSELLPVCAMSPWNVAHGGVPPALGDTVAPSFSSEGPPASAPGIPNINSARHNATTFALMYILLRPQPEFGLRPISSTHDSPISAYLYDVLDANILITYNALEKKRAHGSGHTLFVSTFRGPGRATGSNEMACAARAVLQPVFCRKHRVFATNK